MQRRHLLKASLALAAYTGIPSTGLFALQAFANPANGDGQAFDFDWLKQHAKELAGQPITRILTEAPGNGAAIGGLKVETANGWFAARPSGTEDVYKIYAESFEGEAHLARIQAEAKALVDSVLAG